MIIALTKDMETGVSKIDEQHRELIDRLNQVSSMGLKSFSKEETQKTLDFLGDYVVKHFSDEELLQRQSNYPKYEWHKGLHRQYIENLNKLKEEFALNGASPKFTHDLNKSIIVWIANHIKLVDKEFGEYYLERG